MGIEIVSGILVLVLLLSAIYDMRKDNNYTTGYKHPPYRFRACCEYCGEEICKSGICPNDNCESHLQSKREVT